MICLNHFLPVLLLPYYTAPIYVLALIALLMLAQHRPCVYCSACLLVLLWVREWVLVDYLYLYSSGQHQHVTVDEHRPDDTASRGHGHDYELAWLHWLQHVPLRSVIGGESLWNLFGGVGGDKSTVEAVVVALANATTASSVAPAWVNASSASCVHAHRVTSGAGGGSFVSAFAHWLMDQRRLLPC